MRNNFQRFVSRQNTQKLKKQDFMSFSACQLSQIAPVVHQDLRLLRSLDRGAEKLVRLTVWNEWIFEFETDSRGEKKGEKIRRAIRLDKGSSYQQLGMEELVLLPTTNSYSWDHAGSKKSRKKLTSQWNLKSDTSLAAQDWVQIFKSAVNATIAPDIRVRVGDRCMEDALGYGSLTSETLKTLDTELSLCAQELNDPNGPFRDHAKPTHLTEKLGSFVSVGTLTALISAIPVGPFSVIRSGVIFFLNRLALGNEISDNLLPRLMQTLVDFASDVMYLCNTDWINQPRANELLEEAFMNVVRARVFVAACDRPNLNPKLRAPSDRQKVIQQLIQIIENTRRRLDAGKSSISAVEIHRTSNQFVAFSKQVDTMETIVQEVKENSVAAMGLGKSNEQSLGVLNAEVLRQGFEKTVESRLLTLKARWLGDLEAILLATYGGGWEQVCHQETEILRLRCLREERYELRRQLRTLTTQISDFEKKVRSCRCMAEKQGHNFKNWKRRFIYMDRKEFYYSNDGSSKPINKHDVSVLSSVCLFDEDARRKGLSTKGKAEDLRVCFFVAQEEWALIVCFESSDQPQQWVSAWKAITELPSLEKARMQFLEKLQAVNQQLGNLDDDVRIEMQESVLSAAGWIRESANQLLWVTGSPGCGKSQWLYLLEHHFWNQLEEGSFRSDSQSSRIIPLLLRLDRIDDTSARSSLSVTDLLKKETVALRLDDFSTLRELGFHILWLLDGLMTSSSPPQISVIGNGGLQESVAIAARTCYLRHIIRNNYSRYVRFPTVDGAETKIVIIPDLEPTQFRPFLGTTLGKDPWKKTIGKTPLADQTPKLLRLLAQWPTLGVLAQNRRLLNRIRLYAGSGRLDDYSGCEASTVKEIVTDVLAGELSNRWTRDQSLPGVNALAERFLSIAVEVSEPSIELLAGHLDLLLLVGMGLLYEREVDMFEFQQKHPLNVNKWLPFSESPVRGLVRNAVDFGSENRSVGYRIRQPEDRPLLDGCLEWSDRRWAPDFDRGGADGWEYSDACETVWSSTEIKLFHTIRRRRLVRRAYCYASS